VDEHGSSALEAPAPLILRRMQPDRRHLALSMTCHPDPVPAGTWWELVDTAGAADMEPAAVALTREGPDGSVSVVELGTRQDEATAGEALPQLLRALIAVLRGQAADLVIVRSAAETVVPALLAVGFVPVPGDDSHVLPL
jgi:hypothetical protein